METNELKVYGFWDGDYTFHYVEYGETPKLNATMRVRIDNDSPEERMLDNVANYNKLTPGWSRIRPATILETYTWLLHFSETFPLRLPGETKALRHLRMNGPTREDSVEELMRLVLQALSINPRLRVRDFRPEFKLFIQYEDGVYSLTDEGEWLTSLMK